MPVVGVRRRQAELDRHPGLDILPLGPEAEIAADGTLHDDGALYAVEQVCEAIDVAPVLADIAAQLLAERYG